MTETGSTNKFLRNYPWHILTSFKRVSASDAQIVHNIFHIEDVWQHKAAMATRLYSQGQTRITVQFSFGRFLHKSVLFALALLSAKGDLPCNSTLPPLFHNIISFAFTFIAIFLFLTKKCYLQRETIVTGTYRIIVQVREWNTYFLTKFLKKQMLQVMV